jgi:hypothetical protein
VTDHDAAGAAREEAAKTLTYLAILLVAIPVIAWVERKSADPAALRELRMRGAKGVERFAQLSAHQWWAVAERARLAYEAERA